MKEWQYTSLTIVSKKAGTLVKSIRVGGILDEHYTYLAEELSRRDMDYADITDENYDEIVQRMDTYMDEFEVSGVDHLVLEEE